MPVVTESFTTGKTRITRRSIPAITVGRLIGQARSQEEIPMIAKLFGRPAEAHTLVTEEEEIDVTRHGALGSVSGTEWRTVRQWRE
jgi:hypothetical protein